MVRTEFEAFFSLKMAENGPKMTDARDIVTMSCVRY